MKIVMTLEVGDAVDVLDAQLAFHLNAGVDLVLARDGGAHEATRELLDAYARDGHVQLLDGAGPAADLASRTHVLRRAATEHGADWIVEARADEFWWPRGESLKEIVEAIPPRYTAVQALERAFVPSGGDEFFAERLTVRRAQQRRGDSSRRETWPLRPLYRADPEVSAVPRGELPAGRHVPLRAWYPVEVLRLPDAGGGTRLSDDEVSRGLAAGTLVSDTRLRDALRELRAGTPGETGRGFLLPAERGGPLAFRRPDVVEDAAYAVDCAAVGEVDISRLEEYIEELEARVGLLEARFWPRLLRRVSAVARRSAR